MNTPHEPPLSDADLARITELADGAVRAEHDDLGGMAQAIYDLLADLKRARAKDCELWALATQERDALRARLEKAEAVCEAAYDYAFVVRSSEPAGKAIHTKLINLIMAWREQPEAEGT